MFADASPSETLSVATDAARSLAPIRVRGGVRVRFQSTDGETRLSDLAESGGYRLRFPTTHAAYSEAVQINTGGGIAGGDRTAFAFDVTASSDVVIASQAAERIYRSLGPASEIDIRIALGADARLDWLPQETVLYSGGRLRRRFEIDVDRSSRLTMVEQLAFGRVASGESLSDGMVDDTWHVRRDGCLILVEALRMTGHLSKLLLRPSVGSTARASAILLHVAPDAEERLDAVRSSLAEARSDCAASAWNGMLIVRFLADTVAPIRHDIILLTEALTRRQMPRVWGC